MGGGAVFWTLPGLYSQPPFLQRAPGSLLAVPLKGATANRFDSLQTHRAGVSFFLSQREAFRTSMPSSFGP